jgi:aminoglycoside phosphotransferase family enzyme/predicted kinase
MSMKLPSSLSALLTPEAYPHPVDHVELIETPISWVLLAGELAYKIKRPVRYPFIDLREPERRKILCQEELRLNRRFAPALYLDVCRIVNASGKARIGGEGPILEHAVRMRRFRRADELARLLEAFKVEPRELGTFGRHLALIHAGLPTAPPGSSWGRPAEVQALMIRNLLECAEASRMLGASEAVLALRGAMQERFPTAAAAMAARRAGDRIRECHGDLHSRNIVRLGGALIAFDCLEYEPDFRWIDVADEIAFLSSDLCARARPLHAHAFLAGYLEQSGDYQACRVLRLYEAHRALVRAKVAALSAAELGQGSDREPLRREHASLLAHAAAALERHAPLLLLMHGLSGSGKTWLAGQLAQRLRAIHIRSDVERKRHAGLHELARSWSPVTGGLYSSDATAAVYEQLACAAEDILAGGYTVIVDAAFLSREQRARFAELAGRLRLPAYLVTCTASEEIMRARIAARSESRADPSEADESVLAWQQMHQEPLSPGEPFEALQVETAGPGALDTVLRGIAAPAIAAGVEALPPCGSRERAPVRPRSTLGPHGA